MRLVTSLLILVTLAGCGGKKEALKTRDVTIAAASSLKDLLTSTAPAYEKSHPGIKLVFSFEASSTIARQINSGFRFDAFLSADSESIDRTKGRVVPWTRKVFLANRLALIGPDSGIDCLPRSLSPERRGAIAGPEVPAGKAWRAWLRDHAQLEKSEPNLVIADNVRAALALFEGGDVAFAFVYATDAKMAKRAHRIWIPHDSPEIRYEAGVIQGATGVVDAEEYQKWLSSPEFLSAAKSLGFAEARDK